MNSKMKYEKQEKARKWEIKKGIFELREFNKNNIIQRFDAIVLE